MKKDSEKHVPRFTDMQWIPKDPPHVITAPRRPLYDPLKHTDHFAALVLQWSGLGMYVYRPKK